MTQEVTVGDLRVTMRQLVSASIGGFVLGLTIGLVLGAMAQQNHQLKEQVKGNPTPDCHKLLDDFSSVCGGEAMHHIGICKEMWSEIEAGCLGGEHDPKTGVMQ